LIVEDPLYNVPLKCSEILLQRNWVKEKVICIKNSLGITRGWNRINAIEEERAKD